jgi:hypothetical protein
MKVKGLDTADWITGLCKGNSSHIPMDPAPNLIQKCFENLLFQPAVAANTSSGF